MKTAMVLLRVILNLVCSFYRGVAGLSTAETARPSLGLTPMCWRSACALASLCTKSRTTTCQRSTRMMTMSRTTTPIFPVRTRWFETSSSCETRIDNKATGPCSLVACTFCRMYFHGSSVFPGRGRGIFCSGSYACVWARL